MLGRSTRIALVLALVCGVVGACKDNTVNQTQNTTNNFMTVGPDGADVRGPAGTRVRIPAGALDGVEEIGILEANAGEYPPLFVAGGTSGGSDVTLDVTGKVWAFLPHGLTFFVEATFWLPAPAGSYDVWKAQPGGAWAHQTRATSTGGFVQFKSSGFSYYAVVAVPTEPTADASPPPDGSAPSDAGDPGADSGAGTPDASPDASLDDTKFEPPDTAEPDMGVMCPRPHKAGEPKGAVSVTGTWGGRPVPNVDAMAGNVADSYVDGVKGTVFRRALSVDLVAHPDACGHYTEGLTRRGDKLQLRIVRESTTATPPDFAAGTFTLGTTTGAYDQTVTAVLVSDDLGCTGTTPYAGVATGSFSVIAITSTEVDVELNLTVASAMVKGLVSAPFCAAPTAPACCL